MSYGNNYCNNSFNHNIPCGCGCSSPCSNGAFYGGVMPVGPQGPQGLQGPQGRAGATGPQGAAGTQGVRGPKGDTGATGLQGPAGKAATIRVETTTRVPFDDNPSVVNVGTPQDAVLRFAIPSGMPGARGETGPKGDTGAAGSAGLQGLAGDIGPTGPQGDIGPKGPKGDTGPAGIKTFGQLNSNIANGDLFKDVPIQVPLQYGGESNNVTLAPGTFTIKEDGYYALFYAIHPFLTLTEDYADLVFSLRSNNVDIPQANMSVRATRGTHDLHFYGGIIVKLYAKDVIDSTLKCNEDGTFFFSKDNISSVFLFKVS